MDRDHGFADAQFLVIESALRRFFSFAYPYYLAMNQNITKEMLFNHFAGRTTRLQKTMIEEWLHDLENQETFYQWLAEWEHRYPSYDPQIEEPMQRYLQHMDLAEATAEQPATDRRPVGKTFGTGKLKRWLLAASVILVFAFGGVFFRKQLLFQSYETDFGETRSILLSDGSRVTLNSKSILQVPRFGFGKDSRNVLLQGEAYFSITHQKNNQKFVVKTLKGFDVVVLGTEFSVYARSGSSKVSLSKGKVQVRFEKKEESAAIFLKPGERMTLDTLGHAGVLPVEVDKIAAWKDHRFVFEQTLVQDLVGLFADTYGLKVEIQGDKLPSRTLEGTFQAANADELLEAVSQVLNINIVRKDNVVILHE